MSMTVTSGSLSTQNLQWQLGPHITTLKNLRFEAGQFIGVVGPNGAGKSTLLKALCQDLPTQGKVLLHGKPTGQWAGNARASHMAVLPQHTTIGFPFTTLEVVQLGALPLTMNKRQIRDNAQWGLQQVGLAHLGKRAFSTLSGGEKQRVHIARVLLQLSQAELPPVLLLDEPLSAQDLGHQHQLLGLFRELCELNRFTVISVLHDLNQVMRYCNRVICMANHALEADGEPATVLSPDFIHRHWHYRPVQAITRDFTAVL